MPFLLRATPRLDLAGWSLRSEVNLDGDRAFWRHTQPDPQRYESRSARPQVSIRAFYERLNYDLLCKWFLDMRIDQAAFDATTFTKNRARLLEHEVADEFFAAVVGQATLRRYLSSDHFSVDGTLLDAWASHKSFKPKEGPP
jgi:hypothetical protein